MVVFEKLVYTKEIRVSPRPVWKCRACPMYGRRPNCPPNAPSWRESREWVKSFKKALLIKFRVNMKEFEDEKREVLKWLLRREAELFRAGYPYAMALFPGSCNLCEDCPFEKGKGCKMPEKVRPSLDAIGIEINSLTPLDFSESVLYALIFIE